MSELALHWIGLDWIEWGARVADDVAAVGSVRTSVRLEVVAHASTDSRRMSL